MIVHFKVFNIYKNKIQDNLKLLKKKVNDFRRKKRKCKNDSSERLENLVYYWVEIVLVYIFFCIKSTFFIFVWST